MKKEEEETKLERYFKVQTEKEKCMQTWTSGGCSFEDDTCDESDSVPLKDDKVLFPRFEAKTKVNARDWPTKLPLEPQRFRS